MKKLLLALSTIIFIGTGINLAANDDNGYEEPYIEAATVDIYKFNMCLAVPRIYDNN